MIDNPQGKNVSDFRSRDDSEKREREVRKILVPCLVMIASQLPLTFLYFQGLWSERPHYRLFPLAIAGTALFLFLRWPRRGEPMFFRSNKSSLFFGAGVVAGVLATLLMSPWFAYASLLALTACLLAMTNDRKVFGTLLPAMAPLVVLLQPPLAIDFDTVQGDIVLMATINHTGTTVASDTLDLMQYVHNVSGSRMEFPSGNLDSIALGNHVFSVFTLLIFTGLFIAWRRRPMFRAALLIVAACFWAMAFEALELVICGIANESFERDFYTPGTANRLFQLGGLLGAGLLTVLSDQLITFLFGPVDVAAIDEDISYQDMVCRFWNRAIAGVTSPVIDVNIKKEIAWAKRRNSMPSDWTASVLWATSLAMAALAVFQVIGLTGAAARADATVFSDRHAIVFHEHSLPDNFGDLKRVEHRLDPPKFGPPFDVPGSTWIYTDAEERRYVVALNQPWSGWHNVINEFRSDDWKTEQEVEFRQLTLEPGHPVHYLSTDLKNNMAEYRRLYSCQFDAFGRTFENPATWSNLPDFAGRLGARIANRTDPRLLSGQSIRLNVYVDTIGAVPEAVAARAESLFEQAAAFTLTALQDGSLAPPTPVSE